MSKRITIDPVTRIEGHLRIDAEVSNGCVQDAWTSGTMWRGIENILRGRDARDGWLYAQRLCGVCTTVHAIASVRAVENSLDLDVPLNAQYIRNLLLIAHALGDHLVHFYHLSALDWVDVVSAAGADAAKASRVAEGISSWPRNGIAEMQSVKDRLNRLVAGGRLGIFANGYWGHPAMRLRPEVNLVAVSHYMQALEYSRKASQAVAILGSKTPNIQNLAVGGVANAINLDNLATLNVSRLYMVKDLLSEVQSFITDVYVPDVCAIAGMYPEWLGYGAGVTDYLAVPDLPLDSAGTVFDLPGGTIFNGSLSDCKPISSFRDPYFRDSVSESIAHSWYDGDWTRHPFEEETAPAPGAFDEAGKYSWVKTPLFHGKPMQVGPLAQVLIGYTSGHALTRKWTDIALQKISAVAKVKVTPEMLQSTLGRHAARAIRAAIIGELAQKHWNLLVENVGRGDTSIYKKPMFPEGEHRGVGFHEAPRGALSHWVVIRNGKFVNYQAVVPTTWNAGPRMHAKAKTAYEASLVGNPVADPEKPLEVLRTVHSFDPCLACAVHTVDVEGNELSKVSTGEMSPASYE